MLHATLFLFKPATFDGTHPVVSIHIYCLKTKHYNSRYTGHRFCLNIIPCGALVNDRILVSEYLSGNMQVERSLLHAWCKIRFICHNVFSRRSSNGYDIFRQYLFAVFGGFMD
jgi:hypothetical protein